MPGFESNPVKETLIALTGNTNYAMAA